MKAFTTEDTEDAEKAQVGQKRGRGVPHQRELYSGIAASAFGLARNDG